MNKKTDASPDRSIINYDRSPPIKSLIVKLLCKNWFLWPEKTFQNSAKAKFILLLEIFPLLLLSEKKRYFDTVVIFPRLMEGD